MKVALQHTLRNLGVAVMTLSLAAPASFGRERRSEDTRQQPAGRTWQQAQETRQMPLNQEDIQNHVQALDNDDAPDSTETKVETRKVSDVLADKGVSRFNKDVINQARESGHLSDDTELKITRTDAGGISKIEVPDKLGGEPVITMNFKGNNYTLAYHGAGVLSSARQFVVWNQTGRGTDAQKTQRNYTTMSVEQGKSIVFQGDRASVSNGGAGRSMSTDAGTASFNLSAYADLDAGNLGAARTAVETALTDPTVTTITSVVTGSKANEAKDNQVGLAGAVLGSNGIKGGLDNIISISTNKGIVSQPVAANLTPKVEQPAQPAPLTPQTEPKPANQPARETPVKQPDQAAQPKTVQPAPPNQPPQPAQPAQDPAAIDPAPQPQSQDVPAQRQNVPPADAGSKRFEATPVTRYPTAATDIGQRQYAGQFTVSQVTTQPDSINIFLVQPKTPDAAKAAGNDGVFIDNRGNNLAVLRGDRIYTVDSKRNETAVSISDLEWQNQN